jgi:nucleoside-diphosphate-sugar epimerase
MEVDLELGAMLLPQDYLKRNTSILGADLDAYFGKKILILGGTGFLGTWISATLLTAMEDGLSCNLNFITRDRAKFTQRFGKALKNSQQIQVNEIDLSVIDEIAPIEFDYCIMAATASSPKTGGLNNLVLDFASKGALALIERSLMAYEKEQVVIHLSSGAVHPNHGRQNFRYEETLDLGQPSSPYIMAKIFLEKGLRDLSQRFEKSKFINPRLFTFYGPLLELDAHFAIGNFMSMIMKKMPISITGSPKTVRSYLHAADLAIIILRMLGRPEKDPFNIGSETEVSMLDLAKNLRHALAENVQIEVKANSQQSYYVPSTSRTVEQYGPIELIEFQKGIRDWYQWALIS